MSPLVGPGEDAGLSISSRRRFLSAPLTGPGEDAGLLVRPRRRIPSLAGRRRGTLHLTRPEDSSAAGQFLTSGGPLRLPLLVQSTQTAGLRRRLRRVPLLVQSTQVGGLYGQPSHRSSPRRSAVCVPQLRRDSLYMIRRRRSAVCVPNFDEQEQMSAAGGGGSGLDVIGSWRGCEERARRAGTRAGRWPREPPTRAPARATAAHGGSGDHGCHGEVRGVQLAAVGCGDCGGCGESGWLR